MRAISRVLIALTVSSLLVAACGGDDDDDGAADTGDETTTVAPDEEEPTEEPTEDPTTTLASEEGIDVAATVAIAETPLGDTLVNESALTLYVFTNDSDNTSQCVDACADAWPPLSYIGEPTYGDGLDESRFSTFARPDGSMQVAYDGQPLYTFSGDTEPGTTNGQGVGGVWNAVGPNGPIAA